MIDWAARTRWFGSNSPGPIVCNVKRTHRRIIIIIEQKRARRIQDAHSDEER